ncbi:hypothetical protein L1987_08877 [Smallanthus sonchifolius]|uniref:Uncharacterized protein n=1 Tax=Smallanthus sonchifolius TaxID=185202 RepID=A0ACB9JNR7_9ASTR|nr:hypothetical protein L1987_08877 [Smallanthus sonchifolius]
MFGVKNIRLGAQLQHRFTVMGVHDLSSEFPPNQTCFSTAPTPFSLSKPPFYCLLIIDTITNSSSLQFLIRLLQSSNGCCEAS